MRCREFSDFRLLRQWRFGSFIKRKNDKFYWWVKYFNNKKTRKTESKCIQQKQQSVSRLYCRNTVGFLFGEEKTCVNDGERWRVRSLQINKTRSLYIQHKKNVMIRPFRTIEMIKYHVSLWILVSFSRASYIFEKHLTFVQMDLWPCIHISRCVFFLLPPTAVWVKEKKAQIPAGHNFFLLTLTSLMDVIGFPRQSIRLGNKSLTVSERERDAAH